MSETNARMRIDDAWILWVPNTAAFQAERRGLCALARASLPAEGLACWPCRAGHVDPRARDGRLEVRQAYVLAIALVMSERDGLDLGMVHRLLLGGIEEYVSGCAPELVSMLGEGERT